MLSSNLDKNILVGWIKSKCNEQLLNIYSNDACFLSRLNLK